VLSFRSTAPVLKELANEKDVACLVVLYEPKTLRKSRFAERWASDYHRSQTILYMEGSIKVGADDAMFDQLSWRRQSVD
jgi:hypothetical protein